jgi:hypothetical protein
VSPALETGELVRGDRRKSIPAEGAAKCFGFVQTYDATPKRRLFEVLRSQGMQPNVENASAEQQKLPKVVLEFGVYLRANARWIPNDG